MMMMCVPLEIRTNNSFGGDIKRNSEQLLFIIPTNNNNNNIERIIYILVCCVQMALHNTQWAQ